ncbi:MAG: tRNA pseudouridine(13) synthase TruD, partial [Candidatus Methanomethylophilaceae archaeon]|nr:tRNA pseudouridine(13) synthase TruD [Candidatus Methanomethylophilaceae archaeon]
MTTQRMSFECDPSNLGLVDLQDIEFSNVFRSDVPVKMGDLKGNRFVINVRDVETSPEETKDIVSAVTDEVMAEGGFPNYYGVQRFGISRPVTHLVGERLVRGDLRGAVETYLFYPSLYEEDIV